MYVQDSSFRCPPTRRRPIATVAEKFWPIAQDNGALEHVEAWEADVSDGKQTDFRSAWRSRTAKRSCSRGSSGPTRRPPTRATRR
jgi:uncharacterized protein YbaA (DUF1428 family)